MEKMAAYLLCLGFNFSMGWDILRCELGQWATSAKELSTQVPLDDNGTAPAGKKGIVCHSESMCAVFHSLQSQYLAEELEDEQKGHEDTKSRLEELKTKVSEQSKAMQAMQTKNMQQLQEVYEMKWVGSGLSGVGPQYNQELPTNKVRKWSLFYFLSLSFFTKCRQEALLAAISEKDAHIALLELQPNQKQGNVDEVEKLTYQKHKLQQQLKELVSSEPH